MGNVIKCALCQDEKSRNGNKVKSELDEEKKRGRVYLIAGGTRGDTQPFALLGLELMELGYDITLFCGPQSKGFCDSYGFTRKKFESFKDAVVNDEEFLNSAEDKDFTKFIQVVFKVTGKFMKNDLNVLLDSLNEDQDVVAVIAASTHYAIIPALKEAHNVFCAAVGVSPLDPTKDFAPYFIDLKDPASWTAIDKKFGEGKPIPSSMYPALWDAMLAGVLKEGLPVFNYIIDTLGVSDKFPKGDEARLEILRKFFYNEHECPLLFFYSPILVDNGPSDVPAEKKEKQLGYMFPDDDDVSIMFHDDKLKAFLENGEDPPVYCGWGSMCRKKNDQLVRAAIGACKKLGKRGVILSGWAGLNIDLIGDIEGDKELKDYAAAKCIFVEYVNHGYVFPRCCALVTHGGAGTTAQMLKSGTPGVITPVWWDQNFMGDRLEVLGVGLRGPHFTDLTPDNLAQCIGKVLEDKAMQAKSKKLGLQVREENGKKKAALYFHERIQSFN